MGAEATLATAAQGWQEWGMGAQWWERAGEELSTDLVGEEVAFSPLLPLNSVSASSQGSGCEIEEFGLI